MKRESLISRRGFLATTSSAAIAEGLVGQQTKATAQQEESRLALEGGERAVRVRPERRVRWGEPERERLTEMLDQNSLFYWNGPQTELFIDRFRQTCPLEHVMTCSSGTAAIHIAVAAAGIEPGDEVITSSVTDMGTVIGVLYQQAVPVFSELGRNTYNLEPADVERKITPRTKAIIAVHLCGNPCDMDALRAIAEKHGLTLIEDCAQAWGARHRGKPIGTLGHIACFSLQNSKHVTCGDGGVVASSDERFGPLLQRFGDKGFDRRSGSYEFHSFATNYRMSEPQAAVAAAQLSRLEHIASTRARLGNLLTEKIRDIPSLQAHNVQRDDRCVYWFYMLRLRPEKLRCDRAQFVKALVAEGASASAGYIPMPLYGNPVFQEHGFFAGRWPIKEFGLTDMDYTQVSLPETEAILKTGVRIPIHEAMSEAYIQGVADALNKVAAYYAT